MKDKNILMSIGFIIYIVMSEITGLFIIYLI